MSAHQHHETCGNDCGVIATERNRYFTGKYMTARDFLGEQEYFLSRSRAHNRLHHGWGILCGLDVVRHPKPECEDRWVVVQPGFAIDCCGRELVLSSELFVELPLPPAPMQKEAQSGGQVSQQPAGGAEGDGEVEPMTEPFLLCLRYVEEEIEHVPALYHEGACDPKRREANRVRETVRLEFVSLTDIGEDCWRVAGGHPDAPCRDDCDGEPGTGGGCLEPDCPCGHCVPLALITPNDSSGFEIDTGGRRQLPVPGDLLTHIVHINWPHGGNISLKELRDGMKGQLSMRFDRKLLESAGGGAQTGTGINEHTFVVQYAGSQQDIEFLPREDDQPFAKDDCVATFEIDKTYLDGRNTIANHTIYVTLKCDFILDCHGMAVDGNHLAARLPSGNGVQGGVFESWFHVT